MRGRRAGEGEPHQEDHAGNGDGDEEGVAQEEERTLPTVGRVARNQDAHGQHSARNGGSAQQGKDSPQGPKRGRPRDGVKAVGAAGEEHDDRVHRIEGGAWAHRPPGPAVGRRHRLLGAVEHQPHSGCDKVGRADSDNGEVRPDCALAHG